MYTVLLVIHSIIVLFLIVMVLIQRTDSDGLGGLGGGGGNQFLSGRGTANFMTRTTAILAGAFMLTSLTLAVIASRVTTGSIIDNVEVESQMPSMAPVEKEKTEPKAKKQAPAVPKPE